MCNAVGTAITAITASLRGLPTSGSANRLNRWLLLNFDLTSNIGLQLDITVHYITRTEVELSWRLLLRSLIHIILNYIILNTEYKWITSKAKVISVPWLLWLQWLLPFVTHPKHYYVEPPLPPLCRALASLPPLEPHLHIALFWWHKWCQFSPSSTASPVIKNSRQNGTKHRYLNVWSFIWH